MPTRRGSRWTTPVEIADLIDDELTAARSADDPWPTLERVHQLSQPWAWPHVRVHAAMLAVALRQRDRREAVGQVVRRAAAGPGSLVGRYPTRNTGRTAMGLTDTAELPDEVATVLRRHLLIP
ncbi:DUF3703 domain-containing protein [Actinomarinicola tropica]|uniref:DUF3703 domain-containing protein n=1 Tax=Actinomarinicola tropica TaxID=2789776 RepID=A0A5Q2RK92_9ACTN|nr:DUF3703 domain-containing protein [Actinomarinicola tropica]QGG96253.1 DUF3703 domain-containing protein [Actinomarinicola tropica]